MNEVWNLNGLTQQTIISCSPCRVRHLAESLPSHRTTSWKSQPSKLPWQEKEGLGVLKFLWYRPEFSHMAGTEVQGQLRLKASSPCVLKSRRWCGEQMAMSLSHLVFIFMNHG